MAKKNGTFPVAFVWTAVLIFWMSLACGVVGAADDVQVCTIDADGQETCVDVGGGEEPGRPPQKEICLPDGHCWDSLETAMAEHFPAAAAVSVPLTKPVPFGEAQQVAGDDRAKTVRVLADTYEYMVKVYSNDTTESYRDGCHCRHEHCAFWATIGEFLGVTNAATTTPILLGTVPIEYV